MNELFDYGRPEKILLAILIDRGDRDLPIQADFVAETITLGKNEQIKLDGPAPFTLRIQQIKQNDQA